jgi:regulatory protein
MKTITELKTQAKNAKRVSVYLDGQYYCGLDLQTVVKNRLKVGLSLEESELIDIQRESEFSACYNSALNLISKSVKTEKEVSDKLIKKGYLKEIVEEVIEKVKSYGFIDDKNYAERYVSTYKNVKGKRLIALELKKKGVSEKDYKEILDETDSQQETAYNLAVKYLKNKAIDEKTIRKCYNYLLSRGFSYDECTYATTKATNINED